MNLYSSIHITFSHFLSHSEKKPTIEYYYIRVWAYRMLTTSLGKMITLLRYKRSLYIHLHSTRNPYFLALSQSIYIVKKNGSISF